MQHKNGACIAVREYHEYKNVGSAPIAGTELHVERKCWDPLAVVMSQHFFPFYS